jgi:cytosine/adenosine deaminase-related metal-dependent hydrolase
MSFGKSKGGLPPDSVEDSEDSILKDSQRLIRRSHDSKPGAFVQLMLTRCSPFSMTGEMMKQSAKLAREYGVHRHTHLAEIEDEEQFCLQKFGHRHIGYLQEVDWVGDDVWFAHSVWVNDEEIQVFAKHHCGGRVVPRRTCGSLLALRRSRNITRLASTSALVWTALPPTIA